MHVPQEKRGLLAIDVGGGTQDMLVHFAGVTPENSPKLIMPSPTRIVASKLKRATHERRPVFLFGELMGGGSCVRAAREHIEAGLSLSVTPAAALTFHDDFKRVEEMGANITNDPPSNAIRIRMGDIDREAIETCLRNFEVETPDAWAVAVQDHGFSPGKSNRRARFEWYRQFIDSGGLLEELAFRTVPEFFTRMQAIKRLLPDALLMDTGTAAILGALLDEVVSNQRVKGLLIINVGNYHLMCAAVYGDRMVGLLEHHTGMLDSGKAYEMIERFRLGNLSNDEVLNDGGHGCCFPRDASAMSEFAFVAVTGPNRHMFSHTKFYHAVPCGDVMLAGCFGLVEAARLKGIIQGYEQGSL